MKLMIVESPHKAKVIAGFLPKTVYIIDASIGHIRELPDPKTMSKTEKEKYTDYAIDVNNNFAALYKPDPKKAAVIKRLREEVLRSDEIILATDGDREGEAIAYHLLQLLAPEIKRRGCKISRVTWQEITKEAITEGLRSKRNINMQMVDAALSRSLYDRLFGYSISPVLWRTVGKGTSAGRVQSPVLRLVVNREKERLTFVKSDFIAVTGIFHVGVAGNMLTTKLTAIGGRRFATNDSFNSEGVLRDKDVLLTTQNWPRLETALKKMKYEVGSVESKPYRRSAPPPYTTSSLQQDVGSRLGLSSKQVMQVAQRLYEAGHITYLRTDSVAMSSEAVDAARESASKLFGADSIPASPNIHKNRNKNAQEGHEALRPAVVDGMFMPPTQLKNVLAGLDKNAYRVYECVYNRAVASHMVPAEGVTTTVTIVSTNTPAEKTVTFTTSATVYTSPGWTILTKPVDDENSKSLASNVTAKDVAVLSKLSAVKQSTAPPPRWTEPKLVQALSDMGIGRPATYASMISVNQERGYVGKIKQQLYPTWKGFNIAQYLERFTPSFVAYEVTAQLEEQLDLIEQGVLSKTKFLSTEWSKICQDVLPLSVDVNWDEVKKVSSVKVNDFYTVRVNSYGAWLERNSDPVDENGHRPGAPLSDEENVGAVDFSDVEECTKIFEAGVKKNVSREVGVLTSGPYTGWMVSVREGKFGTYLQAVNPKNSKDKPVNHTLPDGAKLETFSLSEAQRVFADVKLPRILTPILFVGEGKKGAWIGGKLSSRSKKATFISMPDGLDPRTITVAEAEKAWNDAKGKVTAKKNAVKSGSTSTSSKRRVKK